MSESSTQNGPPLGLATNLLHADDQFHGPEVSPSISVTTSPSFYSYLDGYGLHIPWSPAFRQTESPEFTNQDWRERPELVRGSNTHVYSRGSQSVSTRVEHVLSKLNVRNIYLFLTNSHFTGCRAATLSLTDLVWLPYMLYVCTSTLFYGISFYRRHQALTHLRPHGIAIRGGYHGVHQVIQTFGRDRDIKVVDLDDDFEAIDVCWVETPLNPTGEARSY